MTDQHRPEPDLLDTPIMPTGSGVADLEAAREMDALANDDPLTTPVDATDTDDVPTMANPAVAESEAHPS